MEEAVMSRDEAVDKVLNFRDKIGRIPTHEDYQKPEYGLNLEDLAKALDVNPAAEMERLGVRPYAAVNRAVIRAERERKGQPVEIEPDPMSRSNGNLFDNRYPEEE